jgi:16S rRNA C967 or C1407 C5-methylase (RsmB/RsmF family)/NOL1/NOP2/fmu family ribosome biogenesis protein
MPELHAEFRKMIKEIVKDDFDTFTDTLDKPSDVSIRLNPIKSKKTELFRNTTEYLIDSQRQIPWCENGRILTKRPAFTFDPLFHAGCYYVQESASMFLEHIFKYILQNDPDTKVCLDLCAAPGGKSTHLQSLLKEGSILVSNEVNRSRCHILAQNMAKWGYPDSIITNNDPKDFKALNHVFDIILTDMPCSGEGMFRKDTASRDEWSVANVELCASRQRRIIHDIIGSLKPEGWLIYSTCTYNTEENEKNLLHILKETDLELVGISVPESWNISGSQIGELPVYRFFPHKTTGEGFFVALLRRKGNKEAVKTKFGKKRQSAYNNLINGIINQSEDFFCHAKTALQGKNGQKNISLYAIPYKHTDLFGLLSKHLTIFSAGIYIGELKGKDLIPSTALALSNRLTETGFPRCELDYATAIKYLRKEAIEPPSGFDKGHVIVTFKNIPIGFIKNTGNRSNNLYPQEWRIRKQNIETNEFMI